jgi:hypothetical protein
VRNDLIGGRGAPLRVILGRVGVADKRGVVPPDERTVERRANAGIGLRARDDESSNPQARQHGLEVGVLEGVAEILFDQRLSVSPRQLGDDSPFVSSPGQILVGMLHPDNGDTLLPCPLHEAADVRDDGVASMGALDDAGLDIDDQECGVRSVLECGHFPPIDVGARVTQGRRDRPLVGRAGAAMSDAVFGCPHPPTLGWDRATPLP